MSLGTSVGNQFLLKEYEQKEELPSAISPKGSKQDFGLGNEFSDLEVVDRLTENYYNAFSNMKGLAKSIYKTHGIDVTAPDMSNKEQVALNRIWLKSMAKVKSVGNELKRGRENQLLIAKRKEDPDFVAPNQIQGAPTQLGGYTTKLTDSDNLVSKYATQQYNTRSEQKLSQDKVNNYITELESQLKDATGDQVDKLESRITALKSVRPGYDPTIFRPLKDKENKGKTEKEYAFDRHRLIDEVIRGKVDFLNKTSSTTGSSWKILNEPGFNGLYLTTLDKNTGERKILEGIDYEGKSREEIQSFVNQIIQEATGQNKVSDESLSKWNDSFWNSEKKEGRVRSEIQTGISSELINNTNYILKNSIKEGGSEPFNNLLNDINKNEKPFKLSRDITESKFEGDPYNIINIEADRSVFNGYEGSILSGFWGGDKIKGRALTGAITITYDNGNGEENIILDPADKLDRIKIDTFVKDNYSLFKEIKDKKKEKENENDPLNPFNVSKNDTSSEFLMTDKKTGDLFWAKKGENGKNEFIRWKD